MVGYEASYVGIADLHLATLPLVMMVMTLMDMMMKMMMMVIVFVIMMKMMMIVSNKAPSIKEKLIKITVRLDAKLNKKRVLLWPTT